MAIGNLVGVGSSDPGITSTSNKQFMVIELMPLGNWFRLVIEGSLEVKLPTYGRCSNSGESSQRTERLRRERVSRKKIMVNEKVEKVPKHSVFSMFCGSGSRLDKAAGQKHRRFGAFLNVEKEERERERLRASTTS